MLQEFCRVHELKAKQKSPFCFLFSCPFTKSSLKQFHFCCTHHQNKHKIRNKPFRFLSHLIISLYKFSLSFKPSRSAMASCQTRKRAPPTIYRRLLDRWRLVPKYCRIAIPVTIYVSPKQTKAFQKKARNSTLKSTTTERNPEHYKNRR